MLSQRQYRPVSFHIGRRAIIDAYLARQIHPIYTDCASHLSGFHYSNTFLGGSVKMKIVVLKVPKFIGKILKSVFKMND